MVRDGARAPPHHEGRELPLRPLPHVRLSNLILRSGVLAASRRMRPPRGASWFETAQGRLLTMRTKNYSFGRLSNTRLALPSERSSVSGATALTRADMPMVFLI